MSFSIGGDVLSVALTLVIFSIFIAALVQAHQVYAEKREAHEHFALALRVAEQVRDLEGTTIFAHGRDRGPPTPHFSPPAGVALPIAFCLEGGRAKPCELTVHVWRV
jgi:hypothetical protein